MYEAAQNQQSAYSQPKTTSGFHRNADIHSVVAHVGRAPEAEVRDRSAIFEVVATNERSPRECPGKRFCLLEARLQSFELLQMVHL
jgi:hypothetical protein